jgi:hypothetical protein
MATTPINFSYLTRCHAPPAFSPLTAPGPCPVPVIWDKVRAHRFDPGPERPARPCGIISGATLAWMPVVHTRSHQQAAGTKYAGAAGCVNKPDAKKIRAGCYAIDWQSGFF